MMRKSLLALLAVIMVISAMPSMAFAEEIPEDAESDIKLITIEEAGVSLEEALKTFGMSKEEAQAEGVDFFVMPLDNPLKINNGLNDLGTFTFTDYNVGSYRTCNCNKVKIAIQYKPFDGEGGQGCQALAVQFEQYGGKVFWDAWYNVALPSATELSNGFFSFPSSDWINVNRNVDYRFIYELRGLGCYEPHYTASVRVLVMGSYV